MGNLSGLRLLRLNDNPLGGAIPPELGNLANLEWLYLYDNSLSGTIPPELGNLTKLRDLYLHENLLSGPIPSELGELSNLEWLFLHLNALSGPIPPDLGNLSNLELFRVNDNLLSGPIPSALGDLSNLEALYLYENLLSGSIPPALGNLSELNFLDISNNLFTFENFFPAFALIQDISDTLSFKYTPQAAIYFDTTLLATFDQPFSIDLLIDDTVSSNIYYWSKDGQPYETILGDNELSWTSIATFDSGIYEVAIENPAVPDLKLESYPIEVVVKGSICDPVWDTITQPPRPADDAFKGIIGELQTFNVLTNDTLDGFDDFGFDYADPAEGLLLMEDIGRFTYQPAEIGTYTTAFSYWLCHPECSNRCDTALVELTMEFECLEDSLIVAPNVITPDGDGLNDVWEVTAIYACQQLFADNSLVITNRYGDIVYEANPYNNDWGGTNQQGEPLPQGTYYYILRLNVGEGAILKGWVAIVGK